MSHRESTVILAAVTAVSLALAGPVTAQGAEVLFGGMSTHDSTQPVEVTAEQLFVDQASGASVFSGGVVVGQGDMRLSAESIRIEYRQGADGQPGGISQLIASGGVTLVVGAEAAEAREAVYSIDEGTIVLTGDVLLTQGGNALSGERLVVDLNTNTGTMEGRVRTIIQPGSAQ